MRQVGTPDVPSVITFTSDIGLPSSAPDTICGLRVGDASGPSPRVDPHQAGTDLE